jgi:MEMO1 family protein
LPDLQYLRLRGLDIRACMQDGRPSYLLRDPLQISDKTLIVPQALAPLLILCDGSRDIHALRAALETRFGLQISMKKLEEFIAILDEAMLLDNEHFQDSRKQVLEAYRRAPFRPLALAGASYPAEPDVLRAELDNYMEKAPSVSPAENGLKGLVSPHIDYERGGAIYARIWKRAQKAAQEADLVIILGTDHCGSQKKITLTRQSYATPFGVLPTPHPLVERLAVTLGEDNAFADELHHRCEHSIDLAAVWLHYVRNGRPVEMLPVLFGSFSPFIEGATWPAEDHTIDNFIKEIKPWLANRRTLVVAAADLAHVGPAFDGSPLDMVEKTRWQAADEDILQQLEQGSAEGFFNSIKKVGDRYNVCGLPPIYLALRMLGSVRGEFLGYQQCRADEELASWVTVCGIAFH